MVGEAPSPCYKDLRHCFFGNQTIHCIAQWAKNSGAITHRCQLWIGNSCKAKQAFLNGSLAKILDNGFLKCEGDTLCVGVDHYTLYRGQNWGTAINFLHCSDVSLSCAPPQVLLATLQCTESFIFILPHRSRLTFILQTYRVTTSTVSCILFMISIFHRFSEMSNVKCQT